MRFTRCLAAGFVCVTAIGCIELDEEPTSSDGAAIIGVDGTAPFSENPSWRAGRYPDVMNASSSLRCTGTVLGPHAVLTARHCVSARGATGSVSWAEGGWAVTDSHTNPYLDPPSRPAWWTALNAQRTDGRTTDWPAMHDLVVMFVPTLDQAALDGMRFQPVTLDPTEQSSRYEVVGFARTIAARDWGPTRLVDAIPGSIADEPRDGYLTRDRWTPGYVVTQLGDSGGPTFGFRTVQLPSKQAGAIVPIEIGHSLVGATQNDVDMMPLAYHPWMTANQRTTVRLNSLWVQAAASDADNDGLPMPCDPDPSSTTWAGTRCPEAVGLPRTSTKTFPVGLVQCKSGWVPTAISGRSGWLIDQLALKCQPISCFAGGNTSTCEYYWTDTFGGTGGNAFSQSCPSNAIITGIEGLQRVESIGEQLVTFEMNALQISCTDFAERQGGSTASSLAGTMAGATWSGEGFSRQCDERQALIGFEARSGSDVRFVTGLQPICSDEPFVKLSSYVGGQGGTASMLRCPPGTIATGTVQRFGGWVIDQFGLICSAVATVRNGQDPAAQPRWVVQAGFLDRSATPSALHYPARVTTYAAYWDTASVSPGAERHCRAGYHLESMLLNTGALVDRVKWIGCKPWGTGQYLAVDVEIGGGGGGTSYVSCPNGVDGMFVRHSDLLDGLALHCR